MATCPPGNPNPALPSSRDSPSFSTQTEDEFIRRNGSQLLLGSQRFVAVGPNAYWLGLCEEAKRPAYSYPGKERVLEVMSIVRTMGGSQYSRSYSRLTRLLISTFLDTIRATTLGVSFGHPLSVLPRLVVSRSGSAYEGAFNEEAFEAIDYALFAARSYGLRLIIPLVDRKSFRSHRHQC